jgi:hypothetical protein
MWVCAAIFNLSQRGELPVQPIQLEVAGPQLADLTIDGFNLGLVLVEKLVFVGRNDCV